MRNFCCNLIFLRRWQRRQKSHHIRRSGRRVYIRYLLVKCRYVAEKKKNTQNTAFYITASEPVLPACPDLDALA